ncbi:aspartic peptidase domain-containing protein [Aspergillus stella-maris]|uniref:aspartic peptidase domain-containing protein n=1 Tax=Aspergillus stella-maris TaxID=1810926 RepID=UPI003CCE2A9D
MASATATSLAVPMQSSSLGPLFNITVGTPPQPLTVLSDWTWMSLFARSANCLGEYNVANCIPSGQQWYDERASTTYHDTEFAATGWENTSFLPGYEFAVTYGEDTVCFDEEGEICTDHTVFQLSDFDIAIPSVLPFGGIFGLAPVVKDLNETFYPASYQAYLGGSIGPQFGFHSCALLTDKSTCGGGDMQGVFGGTAGENVFDQADLIWFDLDAEDWLSNSAPLDVRPGRSNFWAVQWTGMWADEEGVDLSTADSSDSRTALAVFDEGSEGYKAPMPASALDMLLTATKGKTVAGSDSTTYSVSCDLDTDSLPVLTYELASTQNYTIGPDDYITSEDGACILNVRVWDFDSNGPMGLFGKAFLDCLYVVFDFEALKVGLAPLRKDLFA